MPKRGQDLHAVDSRCSQLVAHLLLLYRKLSALPTLSPNTQTNALFSELVRLATSPEDDQIVRQVLADPKIHRIAAQLRNFCAAGEIELERAWAQRIIASRDPQRELHEFPYLTNYTLLTRLEHYGVLALTGRESRKRMLFVGAGPLPLSSLLLASQHDHTEIDNIDIDQEAVWLATRVANALRIRSLRFWCADVLSCTDIAGYDTVCLAALVGVNPDVKSQVIKHLYRHMRPGGLLLVRTAHSLRTLLYPPLDISDLAGFRPLAVLNPYTEVVNSLVVAEKPASPRQQASLPASAEEL
ncbi:MAG: nicotianamine synthase [Pseudonocardiales bacterium]|jgi:nicotianamine synthase|nr:nicotianamine synthase [Pseudonocardiales bacterium]